MEAIFSTCNEKTVFVVDHSPYFGISSEDPMEFEQPKSRYPNITALTTVSKSLWTCSLEAAIEYCRIVWDLFPEGKFVRFIASDTMAHHFNTWNSKEQNISHVLNSSGSLGPPPPHLPGQRDYSVLHGLRAAIGALVESTEKQTLAKSSGNCTKVANNCRVICITSTRDDESMVSLQDCFYKVNAIVISRIAPETT